MEQKVAESKVLLGGESLLGDFAAFIRLTLRNVLDFQIIR